jgi:hypothetical protein
MRSNSSAPLLLTIDFTPRCSDSDKAAALAPAGAQLQEMLGRVAAANANDEKKNALEDLAARTFEAHEIPALQVSGSSNTVERTRHRL